MKPKPAKIPTIFGLLSIIVIGITFGIFILYSKQIYNIVFNVNDKPTQVRITNITKDSFTISWVTKQQTNGYLVHGTGSNLNQTTTQNTQIKQPSFVHSVEIKGLKPESTYYYQIGIELPTKWNQEFEKHSLQTAKAIPESEANIIFGTILNSSSKPVEGVVVYANIQNVQTLSAITDKEGNWAINLGKALSTDLNGGASYNSTKSTLEIFAQTGKQFSSARAIIETAKPLPPLTLGTTYDFTKNHTTLSGDSPKSSLSLPSKEATESSKSSTIKTR